MSLLRQMWSKGSVLLFVVLIIFSSCLNTLFWKTQTEEQFQEEFNEYPVSFTHSQRPLRVLDLPKGEAQHSFATPCVGVQTWGQGLCGWVKGELSKCFLEPSVAITAITHLQQWADRQIDLCSAITWDTSRCFQADLTLQSPGLCKNEIVSPPQVPVSYPHTSLCDT